MTSHTIIERADSLKKVMEEAIAEAQKTGGTRAVFRTTVELKKNTTVEATARQFHFTMDEPSDEGGEDNGPTPEEVMLAPEEQAKQFQEMVESRCVGHGTMTQPVAMESRWKINGKSVGGPARLEAE